MRLGNLERREISRYANLYDFTEAFRDKTVLVTGSKGIVGSGVVRWLLWLNESDRANIKIIVSTRDVVNVPDWIEPDDAVEWCLFGEESAYCEDRCIDYVVHAAAPTSNKVFKAVPVESLRVIVDGAERMLELAREHGSSLVYLSSEEAYGTPQSDLPLPETYVGAVDSMSTRSCYPLGKKVGELLCRCYFEEYGVDAKVIRPTVILGLWQPYDSVKVEAEIMRCIVEGKDLVMHSDGSTKKCVVYSLDAIAATLVVLTRGGGGPSTLRIPPPSAALPTGHEACSRSSGRSSRSSSRSSTKRLHWAICPRDPSWRTCQRFVLWAGSLRLPWRTSVG